jgi:hypothetical protein
MAHVIQGAMLMSFTTARKMVNQKILPEASLQKTVRKILKLLLQCMAVLSSMEGYLTSMTSIISTYKLSN